MGVFISFMSSVYPPAPKWSVDDAPDMSGKVILITGANTGIGKETARALLTKNAKVYVAARDEKKAQAAIEELKERTGHEAFFLKLNLSNLKNIQMSAEEFLSKETRLDVLINNAGVMDTPLDVLTDDGYDLQFGTNVLGHFYLTKLLLPLLISTAKSSDNGVARVVNLTSCTHVAQGLDFGAFRDSPRRRKMSSMQLYAASKFGNIVFTQELIRRYGDQGIVSISVHPGTIKTELARHSTPWREKMIQPLLYDVSYGALSSVYVSTTPDIAAINGKYIHPWARVGVPRASTSDPKHGKDLWEWMEEQVKDL